MAQPPLPSKESDDWPAHKAFWFLTAEITDWACNLLAEDAALYTEARDLAAEVLLALRDEKFVPWFELPQKEGRRDFLRGALPTIFSNKCDIKPKASSVYIAKVVEKWASLFPELPKHPEHEKWRAYLLGNPPQYLWSDLKTALFRERRQPRARPNPFGRLPLEQQNSGGWTGLPPLTHRIQPSLPGGPSTPLNHQKRQLSSSVTISPRPAKMNKTTGSSSCSSVADSSSLPSASPAPAAPQRELPNFLNRPSTETLDKADSEAEQVPSSATVCQLDGLTHPEIETPLAAEASTTASQSASNSDQAKLPSTTTGAPEVSSQQPMKVIDLLNTQVVASAGQTPIRGTTAGSSGTCQPRQQSQPRTLLDLLVSEAVRPESGPQAAAANCLTYSAIQTTASVAPEVGLVVQTQEEFEAVMENAKKEAVRKARANFQKNLVSLFD